MRFDNPIYDHGFVFPDIADFPDIKHEKHYIKFKVITKLIK